MRKLYKPVIVLIILMLGFQFAFTAAASADKLYPAEESKEQLYENIITTLLEPYIDKEVDKYYLKYLTDSPVVDPYTISIISTERPNGSGTCFFRLKLEVNPYVGAHNTVGTDYITVTIGGMENVKVEKFEHISSSILPINYKNIIKKVYNNPFS